MQEKNGLTLCEEAFQRLKDGKPRLAAHINLDKGKITAGIVSVEAGFDRGYLKRARASHKHLIAQIDAFRKAVASSHSSIKENLKRAQRRSEEATKALKEKEEILNKVLTENMMLYQRVIELEAELKKYTNIHQLK